MADAAGPAHGWPWWAAIGLALVACAGIGLIQGLIITQIGLPSFVVTLAGLLFWEGVLLKILGNGGTIAINDTIINDIASNNLSNAASWVVMLVIVGAVQPRFVAARRQAAPRRPRRSAAHDHAAQDRRGARQRRRPRPPLHGEPRRSSSPSRASRGWCCSSWACSGVWSFLLGRTQVGRYIYAIGGNAEAARRAGINVSAIRTLAFTLTSLTAGIAGIVYASRLRSISTTIDGGTLVLYAVAAAVIGGTSLMGGRGKATPRRAGRHRDRGDLQRHGPHGVRRSRPSSWSRPSSSWPPSRSTPRRTAAAPPPEILTGRAPAVANCSHGDDGGSRRPGPRDAPGDEGRRRRRPALVSRPRQDVLLPPQPPAGCGRPGDG